MEDDPVPLAQPHPGFRSTVEQMLVDGSLRSLGVRIVVIQSLVFALLGLGLAWWVVRANPWNYSGVGPWPLYLQILVGVALGLLVHLVYRVCAWIFPAFRESMNIFRELLGPLDRKTWILLAVLTSVGEELLFRAWLVPAVGIWWSAALFGLGHVMPSKKIWYYPLITFVIGILLGYLFVISGTLLAPVLFHFTVNLLGLKMFVGTDAEEE